MMSREESASESQIESESPELKKLSKVDFTMNLVKYLDLRFGLTSNNEKAVQTSQTELISVAVGEDSNEQPAAKPTSI